MNTVIFLFRVSRRIRPAETYRKRLSSTFRYLSEIRKRLFSPCAFRDHNKNLVAFLQRCSARGVKLAVEKLQLCLEEVPLIGHYATKSGLKIHPEKVRAVLEMPCPTDVKSLLRFNGTVQYLAKFLPGRSDMAHPLRQLTRKDAK